MNRNFEELLPEGYAEVKRIDASDKKTAVLFNLAATVLMILILIAGVLIIGPMNILESYMETDLICFVMLIVLMLIYIVAHELVHGAAYKFLTGHKLTFGLKLSCAYCGVPELYVYRRPCLIAVLAPFVVFTAIFGAWMILAESDFYRFEALLLFAIHISGCVGDLYNTWIYLFVLKDPETLTRDTGPLQIFYAKRTD